MSKADGHSSVKYRQYKIDNEFSLWCEIAPQRAVSDDRMNEFLLASAWGLWMMSA